MICNTKSEFLTGLRVALEKNNITDTRDILTDFRQHFEDGEAAGESEAEVCRKLGDIDEIIKQYITEDAEQKASAPDMSGFGADTGASSGNAGSSAPPPQYGNVQNAAPGEFQPNGGKVAGIICLDVFIYSWAIPTLASLIIALISITVSFGLSGIIILIIGILATFMDLSGFLVTGLAPLSLVFLGTMLIGFAGMLVIASIGSVKGIINIVIAIVNSHAKVFTGHKIWKKIGQTTEV